jgi:hypothetical protein
VLRQPQRLPATGPPIGVHVVCLPLRAAGKRARKGSIDGEVSVARSSLRETSVELLLERIRQENFPNPDHLDRIEAAVQSPEQRGRQGEADQWQ